MKRLRRADAIQNLESKAIGEALGKRCRQSLTCGNTDSDTGEIELEVFATATRRSCAVFQWVSAMCTSGTEPRSERTKSPRRALKLLELGPCETWKNRAAIGPVTLHGNRARIYHSKKLVTVRNKRRSQSLKNGVEGDDMYAASAV